MASKSSVYGVPTDVLLMGGAALVLWVIWRGGIAKAAGDLTSTVAETAVQAAGGVVTGAVTGASDVIGLPTPADTTTDSHVARWIIDYPGGGYWEASKWASAPALAAAAFIDAGAGTPPTPGTKLYAAFPPLY
jgi:hypothetical protein